MKKAFLSITTVILALIAQAQDNTGNNNIQATQVNKNIDSLLPRFCIDVNLKPGIQSQSLSSINYLSSYTNPLNANISNPKYTGSYSIGLDVQGGYFFGKKRHWGIGTGIMYFYQSGNMSIDNYHIEYQAYDANNNVFRQLVTANQQIKEKITTSNLNIPLVLKYKHQLGERWGIAVDGGILFNLQAQNSYNTNASFDYEAIYQFAQNKTTVYDNSPTPATNDWLITKAAYTKADATTVNTRFDSLISHGFNVGLGVKPNSNTGTVSYQTGSIGFILKPSASYRINKHVYLDMGLYYAYQTFKNNTVNNYRLTDKAGSYSSILNSVSSVSQSSFGLNIGLRFYLYAKDKDGDGIPDKKDDCPLVYGLKQFNGCPDTDGDGIPDKDDLCPTVFGLAQFNGCPDTDGDGIPDKDDRCPTQAGPAKFKGCPDRDNDGIPDIDDKCPDVPGLTQFNGCPDTDGDGIPDPDDQCPTVPGPASNHGCPIDTVKPPVPVKIDITTPIQFDVNKTDISDASLPIIEEAAKLMKEDKDATIIVDAYTDNTGPEILNKQLSNKRANAVKAFLKNRGVKPAKVKAVGHGPNDPIAPNDTPEGRAKNRRAVMSLKHKK